MADPSPHQLDGRRRLPAPRDCKMRRHNPEGDLLFINGKVTRKFVENGRHLVEIAQEGDNQDEEQSVVGTGIVELPAPVTSPWRDHARL